MKRCPRCGEMLAPVQVGAAQVDGCCGCGGVWFNNAELGAVTSADASDLLALEDLFLPGPTLPATTKALICPECHVTLYSFAFPQAPQVRLDACPSCKGIWADDGELQALYSAAKCIAHVPQIPDPRRAARQAHDLFRPRHCSGCGKINTGMGELCRGCGATLAAHSEVLCPNCDSILSRRRFGTVTLDICGDCTGVWLDAGELSTLTQFRPNELAQLQEAAGKYSGGSVQWKLNPTPLCPRCCVGMVQPQQVYASGVQLEQCEQCNGLWVDAGQLASLSRHYVNTLTRRQPLP